MVTENLCNGFFTPVPARVPRVFIEAGVKRHYRQPPTIQRILMSIPESLIDDGRLPQILESDNLS